MSEFKKHDILLFMSDQHNAFITETAGDEFISTPNLTRLAASGTEFTDALTSCPLCVPARMSMLSGQLPSRTGIFTNNGALPGDYATVAHSLGAAGYETVLCGRMHFNGPDQFHGFTKRLVGDFTPCLPGRGGPRRADLGPYVCTPAGEIDKHYGGGTSPVLEYDRAVIKAALDYLKQPHDKPIFLLVGTYGPHHTFVAPPELYKKYYDLIPAPDSTRYDHYDLHPVVNKRIFDPETVRCMRAAYYGMIENIDRQVGEVYDAWQAHLEQNRRQGLFCYTSDHGEQAGEKELWGKMTFHRDAISIPLIFSGTGVKTDNRVELPCSIMDITPTLCDFAQSPCLPDQDGKSLLPELQGKAQNADRGVISELYIPDHPARMVRQGKWKYITYFGCDEHDQLFDLEVDPHEYRNCISDHPETACQLKELALIGWQPDKIIKTIKEKAAHAKILSAWGENVDLEDSWRWKVPQSSWVLPNPKP